MKVHEAEIAKQVQIIKSLNDEISRVKKQRQQDQMSIHQMQLQIQSCQMRALQQNMSRLQKQQEASEHQQHQWHQHQNNNYAAIPSRSQKAAKPKLSMVIERDDIQHGKEHRTTVMICNIPNRYTREELVHELKSKLTGNHYFDFLYLPIDFKNNSNLGYAFVNMITPMSVLRLFDLMHEKQWKLSLRSSKICKLKWGRVQGKNALIRHFMGTLHLRDTPKEFRPITIEIDDTGNIVCQEVV